MKFRIALLGVACAFPAQAQVYCSELWDCRERVEITDDLRYIVISRYETRIGRSITAGTGIPYRVLVDDNDETIGKVRFLDEPDILILDMVIYTRQK